MGADGTEVRNDAAAGRYVLDTADGPAIAAYRMEGDVVVFTHTETPPAQEGRGVATRLIEGAIADVRARGLKMRPLCTFVAAYARHHPEVADLIG